MKNKRLKLLYKRTTKEEEEEEATFICKYKAKEV